jgi:hypothetical protein
MTDELEAIRARHEAAKQALDDDRYYSSPNGYPPPSFSHDSGKRAHADRATLLRFLDAAREELAEVREAAADVLETIDHYGTSHHRLAAALKGT